MKKLNNMQSKLVWLRNGIARRIKRISLRSLEKLSNLAYLIRTGKSKLGADIQRFADENGVVSDIHPDDHIFRFLVEDAGLPTVERAVNYYFYNGADSAKKLGKPRLSPRDEAVVR